MPPIAWTTQVDHEGAPAMLRSRSSELAGLRAATVLLAFVFSASRLLWIVQTYSVNVFIGDQWVYNDPTLFHAQSVWSIFRWQSGPWRQGLGGVFAAIFGPLTHWNSRIE